MSYIYLNCAESYVPISDIMSNKSNNKSPKSDSGLSKSGLYSSDLINLKLAPYYFKSILKCTAPSKEMTSVEFADGLYRSKSDMERYQSSYNGVKTWQLILLQIHLVLHIKMILQTLKNFIKYYLIAAGLFKLEN